LNGGLRRLNKRIFIYGTGSMARTLHQHLYYSRDIDAFITDDDIRDTPRSLRGVPIIDKKILFETYTDKHEIIMAFGYHNMNLNRMERFNQMQDEGVEFGSYIDRSARLNTPMIMTGVVIYEGTVLHVGCVIGLNVFISSNVSIGHDCVIGDHVWINSGVALGGGVVIGDRCVLGMNATIAQGVELGEATFVGANTLVTKSTQPGAVIISREGEKINMDSLKFVKLVRQP